MGRRKCIKRSPMRMLDVENDGPSRQQQFAKTKPCKFFQRGQCAKGTRCPFAHEMEEVRNLPNLERTRLCLTFVKTGACPNKETTCKFAHSKEELRATDAFHRTKPCKFHNPAKGMVCSVGEACRFAHVDNPELDDTSSTSTTRQSRATTESTYDANINWADISDDSPVRNLTVETEGLSELPVRMISCPSFTTSPKLSPFTPNASRLSTLSGLLNPMTVITPTKAGVKKLMFSTSALKTELSEASTISTSTPTSITTPTKLLGGYFSSDSDSSIHDNETTFSDDESYKGRITPSAITVKNTFIEIHDDNESVGTSHMDCRRRPRHSWTCGETLVL